MHCEPGSHVEVLSGKTLGICIADKELNPLWLHGLTYYALALNLDPAEMCRTHDMAVVRLTERDHSGRGQRR